VGANCDAKLINKVSAVDDALSDVLKYSTESSSNSAAMAVSELGTAHTAQC